MRGLGAVRVENRPLPLTRPMAYTTACTTVQAVINVQGGPKKVSHYQRSSLNRIKTRHHG